MARRNDVGAFRAVFYIACRCLRRGKKTASRYVARTHKTDNNTVTVVKKQVGAPAIENRNARCFTTQKQ
jgi:hypothetical protein